MTESVIFRLDDHSPDNLEYTSKDFGDLSAHGYWRIRKQTLKTGLSAGVELIEVDNGLQSLFILPTRGMGLWKIQSEDLRVGWDAPVAAPVHPAFVDLHSRNKLGWATGFNELIARCGLTSNGPPGHDDTAPSPFESDLTLHGRIANIPASEVTASFTLLEHQPHLI